VRQRNVLKTAQKIPSWLEHSERVADFATSLFDQTQGYSTPGEQKNEYSSGLLQSCTTVVIMWLIRRITNTHTT
jgi:exopolyphosphatase/guanosine-5'-triphosphate,3'-diphosphate pyrophosphatase